MNAARLLVAVILAALSLVARADDRAELVKLSAAMKAERAKVEACGTPSPECVQAADNMIALAEKSLPLALAYCRKMKRPDCDTQELGLTLDLRNMRQARAKLRAHIEGQQ